MPPTTLTAPTAAPAPTVPTTATLPTSTGFNVRGFITQAQQKNVSSGDIFNYLQTKGYVNNGKIVDTPTAQPAPEKGFTSRVSDDLTKRGENLGTTMASKENPAVKGLDIVGQGAGFVGDIISEGARSIINKLPNAQGENEALANDPLVKLGAHALQVGGSMWDAFKEAHPQAAQMLGDVGNIASIFPIGAGAKAGAEGVAEAIPKVASATGKALEANTTKTGAMAAAKDTANLSKIQDAISPKMDAKAIKLALKEGRIVPGQDPGILKGGTPDQIMPSAQTVKASQTIADSIPGAVDMKPPDLYKAIDGKITEIATKLRPEMEKVPLTDATVSKITNDWQALKEKQLADPYMPTTANLEKLQQNFEKNFLQKSKSNNLADLWDTRIKYDSSVPDTVKNATSLSSDTLQAQKAIWLQQRGILNDAIHNSISGLGKTSQDAFSNMSDMYNAQKGMVSGYTIDKEGAPSLIHQGINKIKEHPIAAGVGAAAAAYEGLKHTVAPELPGI